MGPGHAGRRRRGDRRRVRGQRGLARGPGGSSRAVSRPAPAAQDRRGHVRGARSVRHRAGAQDARPERGSRARPADGGRAERRLGLEPGDRARQGRLGHPLLRLIPRARTVNDHPRPSPALTLLNADGKRGVASMPWTWRYEKADGTPVAADDLQEAIFVSQGDAESWLGENWRALLAVGVDQVTLLEDSRAEYGPMSLHPQD